MLGRFKCVEKPRRSLIGKRGDTSEALRGCLQGNRDRRGIETEVRFAWRRPDASYLLSVVVSGRGYERWGAAIRATLESLELGWMPR